MIKLLIVDDSALIRRLLTDIFKAAGDFEVAIARDGVEALNMLADFAPDVITLDVHMPEMDGLACLDRIMVLRPCPVVMVSALTAEGAEETLEAMALGAVDFVPKPKGAVSLEIENIADALAAKVRAASKARIPRTARLRERVRAANAAALAQHPSRRPRLGARSSSPALCADRAGSGLVLVGCSTGGPPALDAVLGELPGDFPWPILVAQHMPGSFTGPLARRLDRLCALTVEEVERATTLVPGHVYIGRGDADLVLSRRGASVVALPAPSDPSFFWHPSVDRMVESALKVVAPEKLIGVLMTGMGTDGASAMAALKERGGLSIAEAESTAVVWGMPGALVERGGASLVSPLPQIASELMKLFAR